MVCRDGLGILRSGFGDWVSFFKILGFNMSGIFTGFFGNKSGLGLEMV